GNLQCRRSERLHSHLSATYYRQLFYPSTTTGLIIM
ncbi:hypothetical protein AVDCRST_MAG81-2257, partial [uncultured Synechococcales cyanobacterium]